MEMTFLTECLHFICCPRKSLKRRETSVLGLLSTATWALLAFLKVYVQTYSNSPRDHLLVKLGPGKAVRKCLGGIYRVPHRGLCPQTVVNRVSGSPLWLVCSGCWFQPFSNVGHGPEFWDTSNLYSTTDFLSPLW